LRKRGSFRDAKQKGLVRLEGKVRSSRMQTLSISGSMYEKRRTAHGKGPRDQLFLREKAAMPDPEEQG
jgi:hypothetical protein